MARFKIIDDNGVYFTTHTIVEWLPIFREKRYFEIIVQSLKYCRNNKGLLVSQIYQMVLIFPQE